VIAPENWAEVDEKDPVMPTISSTPGVAVVMRVIVPEPLMPVPVMVKVPTVVPARTCGAQKAPARRTHITKVFVIWVFKSTKVRA
jgi:hypothetical protein